MRDKAVNYKPSKPPRPDLAELERRLGYRPDLSGSALDGAELDKARSKLADRRGHHTEL